MANQQVQAHHHHPLKTFSALAFLFVPIAFALYESYAKSWRGYHAIDHSVFHDLNLPMLASIALIVSFGALTWGPRSRQYSWKRMRFWIIYWLIAGVVTSLVALVGLEGGLIPFFFLITAQSALWAIASAKVADDPVVVSFLIILTGEPNPNSVHEDDYTLLLMESVWNDFLAYFLFKIARNPDQADAYIINTVAVLLLGIGMAFLSNGLRKRLNGLPVFLEFVIWVALTLTAIVVVEMRGMSSILLVATRGYVENRLESQLDESRVKRLHGYADFFEPLLIGVLFGLLLYLHPLEEEFQLANLGMTVLLIIGVFATRALVSVLDGLRSKVQHNKWPRARMAFKSCAGTMRFSVPSVLLFELIATGTPVPAYILGYMPISMALLIIPTYILGQIAYPKAESLFEEAIEEIEEGIGTARQLVEGPTEPDE